MQNWIQRKILYEITAHRKKCKPVLEYAWYALIQTNKIYEFQIKTVLMNNQNKQNNYQKISEVYG